MKQLVSRWGKEIDKGKILQEYPRPNLVRESYFNLNGEWDYAISQSEVIKDYDGKILVPFSPETMLSGVGKVLQPDEYLHYRTVFTLPEGFAKSRVLLHFGAVDQECEVFLNGTSLGTHVGGYLPFCFDITDQLKEENVLTLTVTDKTEFSPHARGKQKLINDGPMNSLFYTPQSGIWKTVWLESVEERFIENLKITPMFDEGAVKIRVIANEKGDFLPNAKIQVVNQKKEVVADVSAKVNKDVVIPMENFEPWTPEHPYLYDLKITYGNDEVASYFGMRKFSKGKDKNGILRFFLNNKPYFFNGILDQGYWPESLLTAPSDEALIYDILKLKEYGYNTIRKHIKIEPERFYYHCDRLGMIVWQDMPNGGGDYNMYFVTYLPNGLGNFVRCIKDNHYSWFKREDEEGRKQYYKDIQSMIRLLYNYTSIAVWVPFNEGWGQFDAKKVSEKVKTWDPTRLINEACGWFDQKGGDMYSIHNYLRKLKVSPEKDRVVALTEYGGYAYPVEGHLSCEKEFGYQKYRSLEDLTNNYKRLWDEEIFPNLSRGLSSAIYTQTSDVEEEINGLMTYDRDVDKLGMEVVQELNRKLYEQFDAMT
ncbi:MAG: glycoside hydrolase family 2 [Lachnospiraceae bacterium]|nr:glycoside hydrolase family 2 [Lachnospiraceae bacterium]